MQKASEPPMARKPPVTLSLTFTGRTRRSAELLSKGIRQSMRNRQTSVLKSRSRMSRLVAVYALCVLIPEDVLERR